MYPLAPTDMHLTTVDAYDYPSFIEYLLWKDKDLEWNQLRMKRVSTITPWYLCAPAEAFPSSGP